MEINRSELSQHEFEKMVAHLRQIRRDPDRDSFSLRVHRIVGAIKDDFYHDSFELLDTSIEEILAEYDVTEFLEGHEKRLLVHDLFAIAEEKEFAEMVRLTLDQLREIDVTARYDSIECSANEED